MKRGLIAVGTALALCIGGLIAVVALTREDEQQAVDNLLSEQLTLEIARRDVVDLARLTSFRWDTLLIVERGTPAATVQDELTAEWEGGVNFQTGDLLLFVRGGRVERYADYRGEGRFEGVERPVARFDRDEAVFDVQKLVITPRRP